MYKDIKEVTIDQLKKDCKMIHYFGLGFIQIKLSDKNRIHFYTNLLPPIIDVEDIHNHRYDFNSLILYGNFKQETFEIVEGDEYLLQDESCKEGYVSEKEKLCSIHKTGEQNFLEGSNYFIAHNVFHRVTAENAITFLERSEYKKDLAEVVRKKDSPKICPFSKKLEKDELWTIVDSMLEKAKTNSF